MLKLCMSKKGVYEQMKAGNYKVINKFSKEYIAQIFQEVFYNR